jgi:disulfide bond formation protein DsbB
MLPKITTKALLVLLLLYSSIALIAAYISQFGFDYQPCILCFYQRKPFFAVIALAAIALTFFKSEKSQKIAFFFCIFFLLINFGIASYHVGVEQKIFQGPTTCSSENLEGLDNLEDLKNALLHTKAVRCDTPSFVLLGLSMAAWNALYCLGLVVISLLLFNCKGDLNFLRKTR